jgi:hypothetical protein
MKKCSRCMLSENYRAITFDEQGVCNYCHTYDELRPRLEDFDRLEKLFRERIEVARGRAEYDALVGISGGKDSSYLAYTLKETYGLKILTVTVDNGFHTDFGRASVKRVVESLGLDHFYYSPEWPMFRQCFRAMVTTWGIPCMACGQVCFGLLYKLAFERGIPLIIHGRTRDQMFRDLTPGSKDPIIPCIALGLAPPTPENIKELGYKQLEQMDALLAQVFTGPAELARAKREWTVDKDQFHNAPLVPDWVAYFLYHPYDEEAMKRTLEERTGWRRPEDDTLLGHSDCAVHDAATHLCHNCFGNSLLALELSTAVRIGEMTLDKAKKRLQEERFAQEYPGASMKALQERLGFTGAEMEQIIRSARERHNRVRMELRKENAGAKPPLNI